MNRPWLGIVFFVLCASAFAQGFPNHPLRILVPSVAGSSPDIRARQIAGKLSGEFGQPVIVENRPGANGLIAAREAVKGGPDGHTLFLALINNAIFDVLKPDPCCRLNQELIPVSRFTMTPLVMVEYPGVPARTLKEYIELAKAKPGELTYAAGGTGSISQLVGEWIKSQAGIKVLQVPYKGVNAELPDLHGGQVMTAFVVPQVVLASLKAGKLRALAVTSRERWKALPDVPTVAETVPGYEVNSFIGLSAAGGTPREIVQRLNAEVRKALANPELQQRFAELSLSVTPSSPEDLNALIKSEADRWGKVIREADIRAPE